LLGSARLGSARLGLLAGMSSWACDPEARIEEPMTERAAVPDAGADMVDDRPDTWDGPASDPWDGVGPRSHNTRFRGMLTMHVGYEIAYQASGYRPAVGATEELPHLFVCVLDRDGSVQDFAEANDDILACDRADSTGIYDVTIQRTDSDVGPDIYLATWFCDNPDMDFDIAGNGTASFTEAAEVCIRINEEDWDDGPQGSDDGYVWNDATYYDNSISNRKYLGSRVYDIVNELDGWDGVSEVNWNLSCPMKTGDTHTVQARSCDGSGTYAPTPTEGSPPEQNLNSNYYYNKEFVHMYRSAVQPVTRGWQLRPSAGTVASGEDVCAAEGCTTEIRLHVGDDAPECPAPVGSGEWQWCPPDCREATCQPGCEVSDSCPSTEHIRQCKATACGGMGTSCQFGYATVCIVHASPKRHTLHINVPVHESGHAVDKRWRNDWEVGDGCSTTCLSGTGATTGTDERITMSEGWADFFSVAAWHAASVSAPYWGTGEVEPQGVAWLAGTCAPDPCGCAVGEVAGEGRVLAWLWDLYDYRAGDDDAMDLGSEARTVPQLMRMVSKFDRNGTGYLGADECGPDGRNAWDFRDAFLAVGETGWPGQTTVESVMTTNCMNKHRAGLTTCGACDGCFCDLFDQNPYCLEGICNETCQ
jgi:hypothetical protein